jgi:hypothetical protein
MTDRCEKCEQVAAELRAEFDRLREGLVSGVQDVIDKSGKAVDEVFARSAVLLTDIDAKNAGLLADVDRRVQRVFDTLSERLQNPSRRMDEGPPKLN